MFSYELQKVNDIKKPICMSFRSRCYLWVIRTFVKKNMKTSGKSY
jgi:hypothetical protein